MPRGNRLPLLRRVLRAKLFIADSQVFPWHRGGPLPLLPSGPDGVYGTHLHGARLPAINILRADTPACRRPVFTGFSTRK